MIEKHSLTWRAIASFIESERKDCIDFLIADRDSEEQRERCFYLTGWNR